MRVAFPAPTVMLCSTPARHLCVLLIINHSAGIFLDLKGGEDNRKG